MTTKEERALVHTYDVCLYGGRDGMSVKARVTWANGRGHMKYVKAGNLFDLMIEIRAAIVVSERE